MQTDSVVVIVPNVFQGKNQTWLCNWGLQFKSLNKLHHWGTFAFKKKGLPKSLAKEEASIVNNEILTCWMGSFRCTGCGAVPEILDIICL